MTGSLIAPLIPPTVVPGRSGRPTPGPQGTAGRKLPLATVASPPARTATTLYRLSAIDCNGRILDRAILTALGWSAGTRLAVRTARNLLVLTAHEAGQFAIRNQGDLWLPATLRRACGLAAGDRLLLAADPPLGRLTLIPPAGLDELLAQRADELGGEHR
ncbi:AbrB/MazE/SpoVT family DNA-binding domain-containing protein [Crossiella sp. SN42]|uniref:AbrB/MazE/SpoVT family DNA-binding domain-containing protein n=1 Tax=Crossiella sp. SN42 TaxID=2944808 RepID=UPI00207C26BA|nr:AbrB/MazE/SpoVT family DNA-binding domain-containing protein [Crossiella sp. SN42]MCO1575219.1 AbrB/MazE/SpoVT family DNA-binding domain-containing protein [Crossiella sp. SN42]